VLPCVRLDQFRTYVFLIQFGIQASDMTFLVQVVNFRTAEKPDLPTRPRNAGRLQCFVGQPPIHRDDVINDDYRLEGPDTRGADAALEGSARSSK
jgi:hypothetical protein